MTFADGEPDIISHEYSTIRNINPLNHVLKIQSSLGRFSLPLSRTGLTHLNHTELRHRLGRRLHHGECGETRSPFQQGQEEQLGTPGLALNVAVHWNAIYMQEAIRQARSDFMDVSNDDIAHLSSLIWRHFNFLGRYDFSLPDTVMNSGLRPLRRSTSAWDF